MILESVFLADDPEPWWMVDMGSSHCVGRVNVFNRVDDCCGKFLALLELLTWKNICGFICSSSSVTYSITIIMVIIITLIIIILMIINTNYCNNNNDTNT